MEKELKELMEQAHKVIGEHLCWAEGCRAIFGDPDIIDVKAAILNKGAEEIVKKTTWTFDPPTEKGYDEWIEEKVRWDTLPDELSKAAYKDAFRHQLTAAYLRAKKEQEALKHASETNK